MDELIADQDVAVGLSELYLEGLIEFMGDDALRLTDKGIDYAWKLFHQHTPKEMMTLMIFCEIVDDVVEQEMEEGL